MTGSWKILCGDAVDVLRGLPAESVHCCVTSPPYWGLRDYGVDGQIGLESTPAEYVARMVAVFREVRRVLRSDGTLWLNIGDTYSGSRQSGGTNSISGKNKSQPHCVHERADGLKPKDLVGIPWLLAFALRSDGWYLRSEIIWHKPNPMPESTRDRPSKAHEQIFLLTKSPRYFYDQDAVRVAYATPKANRSGAKKVAGWASGDTPHTAVAHARPHSHRGSKSTSGKTAATKSNVGQGERADHPLGRNLRTVLTVATAPFNEAHFATFPPALIEPAIKAGTSERGCCPDCGMPMSRIVQRDGEWRAQHNRTCKHDGIHYRRNPGGGLAGSNTTRTSVTSGWETVCECGAEVTEPCVVLDCFSGAGTTGLVARRLGRRYIGIELNPEYVEMSERRIVEDAPLLNGA